MCIHLPPKLLDLFIAPDMLAAVFGVRSRLFASKETTMKLLLRSVVLTFVLSATANGHEWTDITGQKKAQATYVSSDANYVYVRLADSRPAHVERNRLSPSDREYVAKLERERAEVKPVAADSNTERTGLMRLASMQVVPGSAEPLPKPATTQERVPPQPNPDEIRFVYRGCGTAQHLAGAKGTTVYYSKGKLIVAALKYDHYDFSYYYYTVDEPGCEKEMWRFALVSYDCCGYRVERYLQVKPGVFDWVCFYCAERYSAQAPDCK